VLGGGPSAREESTSVDALLLTVGELAPRTIVRSDGCSRLPAVVGAAITAVAWGNADAQAERG
tara:strand:+ start:84 stop:272 length:189 start_codon:yes stop_codon:yes gene_type:complete